MIKRSMPFNVWLISLISLFGAYYFMYEAGLLQAINDKDVTFISAAMISALPVVHLYLGYIVFNYTFRGKYLTEKSIDIGFEISEHMLAAGMMGTIIGFIIMTASFAGIDFSNIENVSKLFDIATKGMSTALYTTLVGLVCSMWVRTSFFLANLLVKAKT